MLFLNLFTPRLARSVVIGGHRVRTMSAQQTTTATVLRYTDYGDPLQVVQCHTEPIAQPCDDQVLVKMLLAPINPADINTIQGQYNAVVNIVQRISVMFNLFNES